MDLIRIYNEIAFSRVAESFLSQEKLEVESPDGFLLPESYFIDQGRRYHPELSDDSLRMIYRLGVDDWSKYGYQNKCSDEQNIFQTLACFACEMLEDEVNEPKVHFRDLFRWRSTNQLLGEDLLSCTFLALRDRELIENPGRKFDWPSVLHNDNPHLTYIFQTRQLCELHSHLKASSNVFEITWTSLMNYVGDAKGKFDSFANTHIPSQQKRIGVMLYWHVVDAAKLRWAIYQWLKADEMDNREDDGDDVFSQCIARFAGKTIDERAHEVDSNSETERSSKGGDLPDYISVTNSPMAVYAGERWFLYNTLKRIFATNNAVITAAFYRYVLAKSLLRSYFIQINDNIGFSNFKRFQDVKDMLLSTKYHYNKLLKSLPLWEAREHNYVKVFETRVAPYSADLRKDKAVTKVRKRALKDKETIAALYKDDGVAADQPGNMVDDHDWTLIFHFIKCRAGENNSSRDTGLRETVESQGKILKTINYLYDSPGIDAASSELAARPEVFSHAFRFLRHYGYNATFHAGEDFYDLADGLRAIDEAIHLLKLKASDRLGHAIALGIDAGNYYAHRNNYIALPKQWMLDNVVWILMRSKEFGLTISPGIENFLENTYKNLCTEIGYANLDCFNSKFPDIADYWESMALRGDDPDAYKADGSLKQYHGSKPGDWEYYSLLDSEFAENVRKNNTEAKILYYLYHHVTGEGDNLRTHSNDVKAFRLPDGYAELITALQDGMIKEVSKRLLCIECCPSSNVKIGKLERFDAHPIFRFMPVDPSKTRYPLAVTVNTDDLGVFATSLPNEFSLLALALLKMKDRDGQHIYSTREVYDWIERVIENGYKFTFKNR